MKKKVEVVLCDFNHKHDRLASGSITIDVCPTHAAMFENRGERYKCPTCGRDDFRSIRGVRHHISTSHNGRGLKAVAG